MSPARPRLCRATAIGAGAVAVVLGAAALYPLRPETQEDLAGARYLPPLTRAHAIALDDQRTWIVEDLRSTSTGYAASRAGVEVRLDAERVMAAPRLRLYVLGTDDLGRDLASRLLHAGRRSLLIACASVLVALGLGAAVGLAAALGGRHVDAALMRTVDVFMALPRLLLVLLVATLVPPSTPALIAILGGLTWPGVARLVRAEALRHRETDFMVAARASGCTPWRLAAVHLLPQLETVLAVTATLQLADTVVLESALSFLGLGSPRGSASLGGIIAAGRHATGEAWWVVVLPVLALGGTVLGLRRLLARPRGRQDVSSVA